MNHNDYLEADMKIIPIHPMNRDGSCSCGNPECEAVRKHPLVSNWQLGIDYDEEQIECMEVYTESLHSFGVLVTGYLVIDIDPRNGGNEGYAKLVEQLGWDPKDKSGFVVRTGGGGWHIYFKNGTEHSLASHIKEHQGVDYKVSGFVIGAGSLHKSGLEYEKEKGHPDDITPIPDDLIAILKREVKEYTGEGSEYSDDELASMLDSIYNDGDGVEYDEWIGVGMGIHQATEGARIDLWDAWSQRSDKYQGYGVTQFKWDSFGKSSNAITIGTLVFMAEKAGWRRPVTFTATADEIERLDKAQETVSHKTGCPIDISSVDIYNPPGFVGTIKQWIHRNCLYPRQRLAAMAAIHSVGAIAGINSVADIGFGKTQLNLFSIGLAGSGTGKQSIIDCCTDLFKAAGLADTISGDVRSSKAIYEGLLRHSPFSIIMDEAGEIMGKATGKNKADYQTATSGVIMAALTASKTLTCDVKLLDEARERLAQKYAQFSKQNSENEMNDNDFESAKRQLDQASKLLDGGICDPFFSIYGMSTEKTFRHIITLDNIQSGLVSRGLLIQEIDDNPSMNPDYEPCDLPSHVKLRLAGFMANGNSETKFLDKIMRSEHKKVIGASEDAIQDLRKLQHWFHEVAQEHNDNGTGMTPVLRRCLEKVIKLAAICGAGDGGQISREHVKYATAFVVSNTADLIRRAESIIGSTSKQADERREGLYNMVKESIMRQEAKTSIIKTVAREGMYKRAEVENCIADMLSHDYIEIDKDAPRRSNATIIYKVKNPEEVNL